MYSTKFQSLLIFLNFPIAVFEKKLEGSSDKDLFVGTILKRPNV
jgi:hypothetical protein